MGKEIQIVERVKIAIDRVREFGEGKEMDYGTAAAVIGEARDALADARTAGADVADLRSQLADLEQKARRFYADKAIGRLRQIGKGRPSGYITPDPAIRDARNAIADAKTAGADVSDLESAMPDLEQKAWHFAVKKA